MNKYNYIKFLNEIDYSQVGLVGGKNASLGEMIQQLSSKGVKVPMGFSSTSEAYDFYLAYNNFISRLKDILDTLDRKNFSNLKSIGLQCRTLMLNGTIPDPLYREIISAYQKLKSMYEGSIQVAIRSSATAEDLPNASFAGQQESFLNIQNEAELIQYFIRCYASLFTDRAIKYREDLGYDHMKVALSVCVQVMIRSDQACSGVAFTLDPETGFRDVLYITGSWGLGENVVQGAVIPDEFYVYKPNLKKNKQPIISKKLGAKSITMIYDSSPDRKNPTINIETPEEKRKQWILEEKEITRLSQMLIQIEEHYGVPMDIEWAKDGSTGELYIIQARPETVHSRIKKKAIRKEYILKEKPPVISSGISVGNRIVSGIARILHSPSESDKLQKGEILVTDTTDPDWDPILKKAAAIITDKGGRTSHAAIVAREAGALALVGTSNASHKINDGELISVSCIEGPVGYVYEGKAEWEEKEIIVEDSVMPKTRMMFILGDPDQAFSLAQWPNEGVGLMRLEFIINNSIRIHPMALVKFDELSDTKAKEQILLQTAGYPDKEFYFVEKLSEAVATIAAAFYPKEVIVRMSDFKTNEYANLIGGTEFEPKEENPMIGFRGASRYYSPQYKEGFRLECEAMRRVRETMGFDNVKLMIPFCRTVEEGKKVIATMNEYGLFQGVNGLEIFVMAEIPSNIILAEEFAKIFDGFSIGSNDLTQLTLGIDRDSRIVSGLFDESNEAVQRSIQHLIEVAKANNKKVGICGQAPSDSKEFAANLLKFGIDSISFNADVYWESVMNISKIENKVTTETVVQT